MMMEHIAGCQSGANSGEEDDGDHDKDDDLAKDDDDDVMMREHLDGYTPTQVKMAMITKDDNDHDKDNDDDDMMKEHIAGLTTTKVKMTMTKILDLILQRGPNYFSMLYFFGFRGK